MVVEYAPHVPRWGVETLARCPLCDSRDAASRYAPEAGVAWQQCLRCGDYSMTGAVARDIESATMDSKLLLSYWIRARNLRGEKPAKLREEDVMQAATLRAPSVIARAEAILSQMVRVHPTLGTSFDYGATNDFRGCGGCRNDSELTFLINALIKEGWVEFHQNRVGHVTVTPQGHLKADALLYGGGQGVNGFVAMWFNPSMDVIYRDGFAKGIVDAGYDPKRVDQTEHVHKIDDEIIRLIRGARFVVADYTEHRGGVYYEAGFAHGLGLPVFMTCREDHFKDLHFDIRQYNCIGWKAADDLAVSLRNRIEAVIGRGPQHA